MLLERKLTRSSLFINTSPNSQNYRKRYMSVKGRINHVNSCHPREAEKMLQRFSLLEKPQ